jgi:tripartite-type tricarboxylate transporter receptor subunit TctC
MMCKRLILPLFSALLAACCVQLASFARTADAGGISGRGEKAMTDAASKAVGAKTYPDRPVRLIEPFGVGGGPDLLARALGPKLSELWGEPVSVENHPGAGSTVAPALVAKSLPDGYTVLVSTSAQAYSAALRKDLPYDPLKDFIPVAPLTSQPYVIVAGKPAGIASLRALIAAAIEKPGVLTFASSGVGTATHLGVEEFNQAAGIKAVHIPAVSGDAISDTIAHTIAGRRTYMMAPIELALTDIRSGNLIALGVTTKKRSTLLPEVPTIAEAGVPGFDYPIWYGAWVPAGTPTDVVNKLANDIAHVMATPDLRDWLARHGAEPMSMTQPEFARFVLSESARAARIVKTAGVQ